MKKPFADFLAAARIEHAAWLEKLDAEARQPLDELLRLGKVAGPLVCETCSGRQASFKPLPETPFDWGKVNPDGSFHVILPDENYSAKSAPPKGDLTPEDHPKNFKAGKDLQLTVGATYLFAPSGIDSTTQTIKILKTSPQEELWPDAAAAVPPTEAETSSTAYNRAFDACMAENILIFAIKGPPGTGKTDLLADVALALAARGKNVGIVTVSHAAVNNALGRIAEKSSGKGLKIYKHSGKDPKLAGVTHKKITFTDRPNIWGAVILSASHMYGEQKHAGGKLGFKHGDCDVLLVDEAGQVPAFEAAALSKLAKRVILFGDEDQLPNICHGQHPPGSHGDSSAMRYLRDALPGLTIPLEISHRMNRDICGIIRGHVYPLIKLQPGKNADAHLLEEGISFPSLVKDAFSPPHPRLSRSEKEAERVVEWVQRLLKMQVLVEGLPARPMTTEDIAILTPFRAHAAAIKSALVKAEIPALDKLRIGTVDKMQGQGAAVVIYSLASSSKDYIAAQTEWLMSTNRWNVAISRAVACAIVVGDIDAHLSAIPKALNGIAAQQKIRSLLDDKNWKVLEPTQALAPNPSPLGCTPAPPLYTPPASASRPAPRPARIPLHGGLSIQVNPHAKSKTVYLKLRQKVAQNEITRAELAVPFDEWPQLVAALEAAAKSGAIANQIPSLEIQLADGIISLKGQHAGRPKGPVALEIPINVLLSHLHLIVADHA